MSIGDWLAVVGVGLGASVVAGCWKGIAAWLRTRAALAAAEEKHDEKKDVIVAAGADAHSNFDAWMRAQKDGKK